MHFQQAIQNINLEVAIKINLKTELNDLRRELIVYIEDSLGGDNN